MGFILEISKAGFNRPDVLDIRYLHADTVYFTKETKGFGVQSFLPRVLDSLRKNEEVQLYDDKGDEIFSTAKVTKIYEGNDNMVHFKTVGGFYILRKQSS